MERNDTIELLKECDAGTRMAVSSIDDVLDYVKNERLLSVLENSKSHHKKLESEIHEMLQKKGFSGKNPPVMASGMSWMKTNVMLSMEQSDATIADLMTDGCNMGIKSLSRYMNQYKAADERSKDLAKRLISAEEKLSKNMRQFL